MAIITNNYQEDISMYCKTFAFSSALNGYDHLVKPDELYNDETGYGFYTEELRKKDEKFTYPEINSGFEPYYWYTGEKLTYIKEYAHGVTITNEKASEGMIPLSFKIKVPHAGNYLVEVTIQNDDKAINSPMLFLGRRKLYDCKNIIKENENYTFRSLINVCSIIPRNQTKAYVDDTIDITLTGNLPKLTSVTIREVNCNTIYIAGDSTVTDQPASYPYIPVKSYCGWAQMLGMYLHDGYSISNHSHSGLTTESFRSEGHYQIIKDNIKAGDYVLFQFGHNDQKLPELAAYTGYYSNLKKYIEEIRSYDANPIIVTPIGRNTWKGIDNSYNDLLENHANACISVAKEMKVPLIDLHKRSIDFIKAHGLDDSKRYFFYNDFTHTNDYGAYVMAGFVAEELKGDGLPFSDYIDTSVYELTPPPCNEAAHPPKGYENAALPSDMEPFKPHFTDIDNIPEKEDIIRLAKSGIIPCDDVFRPNDIITRVEVLSMVTKCVNFVPVNVYNDMYSDVVGHEWYAGTVECAYMNGIVDKALIDGDKFLPLSDTTNEMLISYIINGLKSRKTFDFASSCDTSYNCSKWSEQYIYTAKKLGLINKTFEPLKKTDRKTAASYLCKLRDMIL